MIVSRFLLRPLLRLVVVASVVVATVCVLVGRPVTRRVSGVVSNALCQATSKVASHDLAVLGERLDAARQRLGDAESRRDRLVALLEGAKARRVALLQETAASKVVLSEIAVLLGSPGPVVMVAAEPYSRDVIEKDAVRTVRQYEHSRRELRDLEAQVGELTAALARVDEYVARSREVLASRNGLVSRLEDRAECQRLLRELGELLGEDDGFEMRFERAAALISPSSVNTREPDREIPYSPALGTVADYRLESP